MNSQREPGRSSWKQWVAAFAASSIMFDRRFLDIPWKPQSDLVSVEPPLIYIISIISIFIVLIGAFLGAILADIFGRKKVLLAALIFVIPRVVGFVFISQQWIWVVKIFTEFGAGITCTVVPLYISEIAGINNRVNLMNVQSLTNSVGMFIILGLRLPTIDSESQSTLGNIIDGICLGIAVLFHGIVIAIFPETPHYLNSKKNYQEAARSLAFFRGMSHVKIREESHELLTTYAQATIKKQGCCGKVGELFRFANRRSLAIIFSLIAIRWASGQHVNDTLLIRWMEPAELSYYSYIYCAIAGVQVLLSGFTTLIIDIFKRKMSVILVILVGLIAAIVGVIAFLVEVTSDNNWIQLGVFVVQGFGHFILLGVTLAYVGELFPTNVKALAIATVISFEVLIRNIFFLYNYRMFRSVPRYDHWVSFSNGLVYFIGLIFVSIFFPRINKLPYSEIEIETPTGIQSLS